jgi:sugar (pentulose or hexulose) kinase
MSDQLFIGIDSGTQGTKGIAFSREAGRILAEAYTDHQLIENIGGRREQQPGWWIEACSTVIGRLLNKRNVSRDMICAIGVAGQQHDMVPLDVLKQQGLIPTEIRLVGGGAKSPLWRQIVADVFDCPVVCPESSEAGAVGAALQAMWCYIRQKEGDVSIGELTDRYIALDESTRAVPDASIASQYAEIYKNYLQLNDVMKHMF